MNEKEIMNLINSIDDDLVDQKIDDLLSERGESINMEKIKEKAMSKITPKQNKRFRFSKKVVAAAAVVLTLTVTTVYAKDISAALKSFFNKSVVYNTVVDGDAYYLPEKIKLDDKFTLSDVSVSKGKLDMSVMPTQKLSDQETENLNIKVTPTDDKSIYYEVAGYGRNPDGAMTLSFANAIENNYNITPFKDFTITIGGNSYDISLAKADGLKTDESLVLGNDEHTEPLIANVAASAIANKGLTNIQLVAGFDHPDLKLKGLGLPGVTEYKMMFENNKDGILGVGGSGEAKPIVATDKNGTTYILKAAKDAVGSPVTLFETDAKEGTDLNIKVPAVVVGFEKEVANIDLTIPKEGSVTINKELDFVIQKVNVKSISRTSKDTALVEFELNTGDDKTVSITDLGAYSKDVKKAETMIKGNTATMEIKLNKDTENTQFTFSWPHYMIEGSWSIDLGGAK